MAAVTFFLSVCTAVVAVCCAQCGNSFVWRNNNITCPRKAVCADVFNNRRDWFNGTTCDERRVLSNCLCSSRPCPVDNPAHKLFSTTTHQQYLCEPVCSLPYCSNINIDRGRMRSRNFVATAMSTEQRAPEFGHRTYYKANCRCPRQHWPVAIRGRRYGMRRAIKVYQQLWANNRFSTLYKCDATSDEMAREDPCPPRG